MAEGQLKTGENTQIPVGFVSIYYIPETKQYENIGLCCCHLKTAAKLQQIVPLLYSSLVILQKSVNLWVTGNKEDKTLLENINSMALRMIEGCRFGTALAHDIGTYSRQKPLPDTACVPPNGISPCSCVNCTAQLPGACKPADSGLNLTDHILDKGIQNHSPRFFAHSIKDFLIHNWRTPMLEAADYHWLGRRGLQQRRMDRAEEQMQSMEWEKFDRVPTLVNDRTATDTMYMDLCKAFLPVADNIFISHLERCGVYSWNINCGTENGLDGLTQRVVVNISMSVRRKGMRGDLQRLILVPLLLPIFVRHRDDAIDCPFSKIGNGIKVSGVVACLEGRDGTQRDLDRLGRLGGVIVMKVNRTKCNVLNLNWSNLNNGH
ncbi:hypothetical protein TURU_034901 [Turdus rufiventris]|nr:hypothetical protein TURU_034901 [Turdus rufiventris]